MSDVTSLTRTVVRRVLGSGSSIAEEIIADVTAQVTRALREQQVSPEDLRDFTKRTAEMAATRGYARRRQQDQGSGRQSTVSACRRAAIAARNNVAVAEFEALLNASPSPVVRTPGVRELVAA